MKRLLWTTVLAVSVAIGSFGLVTGPLKGLPHESYEASKPILRMELVSNSEAVEKLLGKAGSTTGDARRAAMRSAQYVDFFFIAAYVALFAVCVRINAEKWLWLGLLATVLIVAAAFADIFEDLRILDVLKDLSVAPAIRWWALWKWGLFAAAVFVEGMVVAFRERSSAPTRWLAGAAGAFAMASAALCLWSLRRDDASIDRNTSLVVFAVFPIVASAFIATYIKPNAASTPPSAAERARA